MSNDYSGCNFLKEVVIWHIMRNLASKGWGILPASVTSIVEDAFGDCNSLTDVYYSGSEAEWKNIEFIELQNVLSAANNTSFANATIHYNYVPEE